METPFSLTQPKYDMGTFLGRYRHFIDVTDPTTLLSSQTDISVSLQAINKYRTTGELTGSDAQMWAHKKVVDAAVHPATGEIIPFPFRVSAIAPVNIPIVWAMIATPAANVPVTMFLQWLNQSYNTACNYYNRSGATMSVEQTAKAYGLAVVSACGFAYGLGKVVERGPPALKAMGVLIPLLSVGAANISNLGFTRISEMTEGVAVTDDEGNVRGVSKTAGVVGVVQTAATRCVMVPAACLLLPPVVMAGFKKLKVLPKGKTGALLVELGVIYLSLQFSLPAALAVFPQTARIDVRDLEPEFANLVDSHGVKITHLSANKGL